jgi:hypothetical protein
MIPIKVWLNLMLSFKYISNIAIITAVLSYYMNMMNIFFIMAPLIIVNYIVLSIIQIFELDELIKGLLGDYISNTTDYNFIYTEFMVLSTLWHLGAIFWLYLVMGNNIKMYKPNFMKMFLISASIFIIYILMVNKLKVYGNINYELYVLIYMITLLVVCIKLYY